MHPLIYDNINLKKQKKILEINSTLSLGATTSISIVEYTGEPIPSGTQLIIKAGGPIFVTTSAVIESRATSISVTSFDLTTPVMNGTKIEVEDKTLLDLSLKQFAYAHQSLYLTAGTNGNDYLSAFGTSSFSVNSATTLADGNSKPNRWASQFSIFVAPAVCRITELVGWSSTNTAVGDDATLKVWTATPNGGGTSNLTIDLVHSYSLVSVNNQNHLFDLNAVPTTNIDLAKGDIIFVSIQRTGTKASGKSWYADLGIKIKTM